MVNNSFSILQDLPPASTIEDSKVERSENIEEPFVQATAKAEEVGKGWWQGLKDNVGYLASGSLGIISGGATMGINALSSATSIGINKFGSYTKPVNKESKIADYKQQMLNFADPQFVELYDMACLLINTKVSAYKNNIIKKNEESAFSNKLFLDNEKVLIDVIEIHLAKGFVNLARQVHENRNNIPNYDNQPFLVNLLSFFSQKIEHHINTDILKNIEEKYRQDHLDFAILAEKLFPDFKNDSEKKELIQKLIDSNKIIFASDLFDIKDRMSDKSDDINNFICTLNNLESRRREIYKLFDEVSDDILATIFPKKFEDVEIPLPTFVLGIAYNIFVKNPLMDSLKDYYNAFENNANKLEEWKSDLQTRVGAPDLQSVLESPSAMVVSLAKNYVQTNPKALELTTKVLNDFIHPKAVPLTQAVPVPSTNTQAVEVPLSEEEILAQLSMGNLADWIVRSAQVMLRSEDPHLLGMGQFVKQALNTLTVAFMAQGAKLVIPEGEVLEENHFLKELADRVTAKMSSLIGNEVISDETWMSFIDLLPLPPETKNALAPLLIEGATDYLQTELKSKAPMLADIQKMFVESEKEIKAYKGGEKLFLIMEKISDQIVEQVLEKNVDLVSTFGLGETLDELFEQYLPGIQVNDDLKIWLKENISALGASDGASPQSIILLKYGLQAVILKAMVTTIEANFEDGLARLCGSVV